MSVEVARLGGRREVVFSEGGVPCGDHPTPTDAPERGCNWPAAAEIVVDAGWRSGYYEVLLTIDVGAKLRTSRAFFVVRPDLATTTARILWAIDTNTWHAYNDFGGRNLYSGATQVSLQRPMAPGYLYKPPGAGQRVTSLHPPDHQSASHVGYLRMNHLSPWGGSAGWPNWSGPFIDWAEREGYGIDVVTNADLEEHPELLGPDSPYSLYLSIGHDEYWSAPMRDTVEAFAARGGHTVFFSGNTAFWQVRLEDPTGPGGSGPAATMVGYKGMFKRDPVFGTDRQAELTTIWSDHLLERPENHMTGVSFSRGGYHRIGKRATRGAGGYTLHRPEHWIFDGTGLDYGDVLGAAATIVGYECDGCDFTYRDGLPVRDRRRRDAEQLRDSGHRAGGALHPDHGVAAAGAPRAVGDRVHLLAVVRGAQPRGGRTDRARPRRARLVRDTWRRHGDHQRLHGLGLGPRRARPRRRADHPQHLRPPRLIASALRRGSDPWRNGQARGARVSRRFQSRLRGPSVETGWMHTWSAPAS